MLFVYLCTSKGNFIYQSGMKLSKLAVGNDSVSVISSWKTDDDDETKFD